MREVTVLAIGLAWGMTLRSAYLPVVGPAPLRFESPHKAPSSSPTLPSLALEAAKPAPLATAVSAPTTVAAVPAKAPSEEIAPAKPDLTPLTPATNQPPAADIPAGGSDGFPTAGPGAEVSPQAFLPFFRFSQTTNGIRKSVEGPIFLPPQLRPPASSKATYQSQ